MTAAVLPAKAPVFARFWASARSRATKLSALVPDRFTATQFAGAGMSTAGAYLLWGLGVSLFAVGLSVVAASVLVEGKS